MGELMEAVEALAGGVSDARLAAVVAACRKPGGAAPRDVARLAEVLAASGVIRARDASAADVASSGGPGSLTTLLSPLALVGLGLRVPKVAVPGRPAGGIDALGTVPGYRTSLSSAGFDRALAACGYAHSLAGNDLAPLDWRLFAYRQTVDAQRVAPLVVASLLSKKIAAGLATVVLDVRVGPGGNMGTGPDGARAASQLFVETAALVGIRAVCVLSATSSLRQPFVGRGEALLATAVAAGVAPVPSWLPDSPAAALTRHVGECRRLAALAPDAEDAEAPGPSAHDILFAHLAAQGADDAAFRRRAAEIASAPVEPVCAPGDGHLTVDLTALRDAIVPVNAAAPAPRGADFPDAAGVTFLAMPGDEVRAGQPVARVRGPLRSTAWLSLSPDRPERPGWDGETVR